MIIIGEDLKQICKPNSLKDTYRTLADKKNKDWRREKLREKLQKSPKSAESNCKLEDDLHHSKASNQFTFLDLP